MKDVYFNLLIYTNIDTLISFCLTNKTNHLFIKDAYFWNCKFNQDKLKIVNKDNDYIDEYKRCCYVKKTIKNIKEYYFFDFKKDIYDRDIIFNINIDDDLSFFPESFYNEIINANNLYEDTYLIKLNLNFYKDVTLNYIIYDEDGDEIISVSKIISKSAITDTLKLLLYHLNHTEISFL